MDFEKFRKLSEQYNVVPVYEKITADLLTPVLAYLKIREKNKNCFLLESVEGIGRLARYSFIGKDPQKIVSNKGMKLTIKTKDKTETIEQNIFDYLQNEIKKYSHPLIEELPDFTGGIVGYLGFENVGLIENVIKFSQKENIETPDSIFGIYNTLLVFDHYKHKIILITNVHVKDSKNLEHDFINAKEKLKRIRMEISRQVEYKSDFQFTQESKTNANGEYFCSMVEKGKDNIYAGDVFQLVPSKRFSSGYRGDLLNVYRALRIINPSPYMYFLEYDDDFTIIGTSPEDLLKVRNRKATILPIAGTRRRGKTESEDIELEKDLLQDKKELAEHVMLVDLARNDLGRVSKFGTVEVTENMTVHRYSHVMHIVSRVEGELEDDKDCIDALKASFPAGTVTGAPKIRAIQLINEYELIERNVYAGAVGYIDFNGNLDMCIAIRTLFAKDKNIYWQAGAGIVADSIPEMELQEVHNKSAALVSALKHAEVIDEDISYR